MDRSRRIVGWTSEGPEAIGSRFRHAAAEKLIGQAITCACVQIHAREAAERAGAPPGWTGPWRCPALIAAGGARGVEDEGAPLIDVTL